MSNRWRKFPLATAWIKASRAAIGSRTQRAKTSCTDCASLFRTKKRSPTRRIPTKISFRCRRGSSAKFSMELTSFTIDAARAAIQERKTTSTALVESFYERIEKEDGEIGAFL